MITARTYFIKMIVVLGFILGIAAVKVDWVRGKIDQQTSKHTVSSRVAQFGEVAMSRLQPHLSKAKFDGLPAHLLLVAFKKERRLEVYGREKEKGKWRLIRQYPILAASGQLGPKLREGDRQVPEGIYLIEGLNPNSGYHVSMRVNYPSPADQRQAKKDGRDEPGSDIYVHGKALSSGCIAVGDPVSEELFLLTAHARRHHKIELLISPMDTRVTPYPKALITRVPQWTRKRYDVLRSRIKGLEGAPKMTL